MLIGPIKFQLLACESNIVYERATVMSGSPRMSMLLTLESSDSAGGDALEDSKVKLIEAFN